MINAVNHATLTLRSHHDKRGKSKHLTIFTNYVTIAWYTPCANLIIHSMFMPTLSSFQRHVNSIVTNHGGPLHQPTPFVNHRRLPRYPHLSTIDVYRVHSHSIPRRLSRRFTHHTPNPTHHVKHFLHNITHFLELYHNSVIMSSAFL